MATKTIKIGLSDSDKATMKTQIASDVLDEIVNGEVEISGSETNLTELKEDIDEAVSTVNGKANVDGNYPTMTVGNADQLNSPDFTTDQAPYLFRTSGGDADIGNREKDTIVGGSLGWNQLIAGNDTRTVNGITFTSNGDGTYTISGIATAQAEFYVSTELDIPAGHKLLLSLIDEAVNGVGMRLLSTNYGISGAMTSKGVISVTGQVKFIKINVLNGTDLSTPIKVKPVGHDLTAIFGATIADYIYNLETATAGAGVAWFRKLFNKPYYPYKAIGGFLHVKLTSHDMVGFNQWDEQWGNYVWNENNNGIRESNANAFGCKEHIRVLPNTTYYLLSGTSANFYVLFYDTDKNLISYSFGARNRTFTTPVNCDYITFYSYSSYPNTYKGDIAINLSWSGWRNGQYEAYKKNSYPLDTSIILRGIPKLDADNNLYYDGDRYESTGKVTRKYGIVDLATLTFAVAADGTFVRAQSATLPLGKENVAISSPKYTLGNPYINPADNIAYVYTDGGKLTILVRDTNAGTNITGYLVYPLATSTEETADPFQETQEVDDFGTEEYVVPAQDGVSIPVGHYTEYPENLRDKLRRLPNMPTVSESTTATYAVNYNGQTKKCSFVPINDWLVANGYPTGDALKEVLASKEALGGTLRQMLAVSNTLDFNNTAYLDLGDLTWTKGSSGNDTVYYAIVSDLQPTGSLGYETKMICTKFKTATNGTEFVPNTVSGVAVFSTKNVCVKTNDYADATAFKAAMKGVLLAYEKASE